MGAHGQQAVSLLDPPRPGRICCVPQTLKDRRPIHPKAILSRRNIRVSFLWTTLCAVNETTRSQRPNDKNVSGKRKGARQPVSRVLSAHFGAGRPFLWDASRDAPLATNPGGRTGTSLRSVSSPKTRNNRGHPYSVLLPVGFTMPPLLPGTRCALTAPFRPCPRDETSCTGGLFSVALSLGSPPPAVSRHRVPMEPGLSSALPQRPSGCLANKPVRRVTLLVKCGLGKRSANSARSIAEGCTTAKLLFGSKEVALA